MNLRKQLKYWLHSYCPGFRGCFPYFGSRVFFPRNSLGFLAACQQGIFEAESLRILQSFIRPNTTVLDVGTNIGLIAIPLLRHCPTCSVISFEPSPLVLPHLRRTIAESAFAFRWHLVEKAVGARSGETSFSVSAIGQDMYDSIHHTGRSATSRVELVPLTTIDGAWQEFGKPDISAIKIDVEGGELDALRGARECVEQTQPAVLLEWNTQNLTAHSLHAEAILPMCEELCYRIFSVPFYVEVRDARELRLQMIRTENFVILPSR